MEGDALQGHVNVIVMNDLLCVSTNEPGVRRAGATQALDLRDPESIDTRDYLDKAKVADERPFEDLCVKVGDVEKEEQKYKDTFSYPTPTTHSARLVLLMANPKTKDHSNVGDKAVNQRKASDVPDCEETLYIKIVAELRRQTRTVQRFTVALDARLEMMHEKREILRQQIEENGQNISNMTNQQEHLRLKLKEVSTSKTSQLLATALQQRMVKRHHEFKSNKWKIHLKLSVEEEVIESQRKCVALHELVQEFRRDMPELQDKLEIVSLQLDLAIKYSSQPSGVSSF